MANILGKFLDGVYKIDSLIQEKYQEMGGDEQSAVCGTIVTPGIIEGLYLSSTEGGLISLIPILTSFGMVLYLNRKNIINDMRYNILCAELGSSCQ